MKDLRLETLKEFKRVQDQWATLEFMKSNEQIKIATKNNREILMLPELADQIQKAKQEMEKQVK